MRFYSSTQALPWPRSYLGKIFAICFICVHVPLIAILSFAFARSGMGLDWPLILVALGATLFGTGLALLAMGAMLKPVLLVTDALDRYASGQEPVNLPRIYTDEAGRLMAQVQLTVDQLDATINELRTMTLTDPLTGAKNRRWLEEKGIPQFKRQQASGGDFSLLVIDLDKFKHLNDTAGHSVGDEILVRLVEAMSVAVRGVDSIVRTGGDEFCVCLPGADAGILTKIADRLHKRCRQTLAAMPNEHGVTLSIGGATMTLGDESFAQIYRRADTHLYNAKEAGRDTVIIG